MDWDTIDWSKLEKLRSLFLEGTGGVDYWEDASLVELYDWTFAQRIGWKWDAVLSELFARHWHPPFGARAGLGMWFRCGWPCVYRSFCFKQGPRAGPPRPVPHCATLCS